MSDIFLEAVSVPLFNKVGFNERLLPLFDLYVYLSSSRVTEEPDFPLLELLHRENSEAARLALLILKSLPADIKKEVNRHSWSNPGLIQTVLKRYFKEWSPAGCKDLLRKAS